MMKSTHLALGALLLSLASHAFAQEDVLAIDKRQDACLGRAQSTAAQVECAGAAYDDWDSALNAAYTSLMQDLNPAQKESLRTSQRQWLAYRDAYFKTLASVYNAKDGTIFRPMHVQARVDVVKLRVLQLRELHHIARN